MSPGTVKAPSDHGVMLPSLVAAVLFARHLYVQ